MNKRNNGSITVEALLLVPALFAFSSLIVYVGRMTEAAITVRHAADSAARVASRSNTRDAFYRAVQSAKQELNSSSSGCGDSEVHIRRSTRDLQNVFVVSVKCVIDTRGLGVLALTPVTVDADSIEVVDIYTAR